jgi:two-component system, chemotaxis family, protein-glutamate methylesterase/glutaminase
LWRKSERTVETKYMQPVRVLVVDGSAVIRKLLSNLLASDPEIVVAGTAGSGSQALARIPEVEPDLVALDIEMPGMDGLETLVEIRKLYPRLPVIMLSATTELGATATLDALACGASDYVHKPSCDETAEYSQERVREDLLRKIKSLCAVRHRHPQPGLIPSRVPSRARIDVIAIGASTGGPNALTTLVAQLPADLPVPVVIVQHMPPLFTRLLAERLNGLTSLKVQEGREGQRLERGQVWLAPGDHHMTVSRRSNELRLGINHSPQENSCRPSVDVLFRSVAQACGANVLGVVLTGMGTDGTLGSAVIREAGAEIIVQDEASSVVWGMPGSVVAAGLADHIYALDCIAPEIVRRVSTPRAFASAGRT